MSLSKGAWAEWQVGTPSASEYTCKYWPKDQARSANGRKPVIFCHGFYLATPTAAYDAAWSQAYAEAGHPTIASELGGGSTWGNSTARARFLTQVSHMGSAHGCLTTGYGVAAESMGTILALRMWWEGSEASKIDGMVLRAPIFDFEAFHDRNAGVFGAVMEAAHAADGGYAAVKASMNASTPANKSIIAANASKIAVVYGTQDEYIPPSEVETYCAEVGITQLWKIEGNHAALQLNPAGGVTAGWMKAALRRN